MEASVLQTPAPTAPEVLWDGVVRGYIPGAELRIPPGLRLHRTAALEIDPITYEVVRYALLNANLEHGTLLQRLCVSPVTMLTRDFQASILSEDGDVVFFGPDVQYFSMAHALTTKWILENRSVNPGVNEGDMFLSNDPFVGAPHQSDTAVLAPVFVDGELFCWVANILHHVDLGGSQPGSFCLDARDAWSEPTAFPPVKLVDAGELRADLEDLFVRQSRFPINVRMDLRAAVSANTVTRDKILALVDRYGAEVVKGTMYRTLDASEQTFAERLRAVPDGRWSHRTYTEVAVPGDRGVYRYQVNVRKQGDLLHVDNEGTDPQAGSINSTFVAFAGAVIAALTSQMAGDLAGAFGGLQRRVRFHPLPGTLSCADFPASVSPAGALTNEVNVSAATTAISKMLLCGGAEQRALALGPSIPHWYAILYSGLTEDEVPYVMVNIDGMIGSPGGMPDRDGPDAGGHHWIPGGIAFNLEDIERQYPVLYLYRRFLRAGADGAGAHRGGLGFAEAGMPWQAARTVMHVQMNEAFPKAQGQMGGNPGSRASFMVRRDTDVRERLGAGAVPRDVADLGGDVVTPHFKDLDVAIGPSDVWEWTSPNAPGCGDPLVRNPELVLADVAQGYLDAAVALRTYGVVIGASGVDETATAARRDALRVERLARADAPTAPRAGEIRAAKPVAWIGPVLELAETDDEERLFRCGPCGAALAASTENYKNGCAMVETPIADVAPEFATGHRDVADLVVLREFLCPACGHRCDTEIARAGDEVLWDIRLDAGDVS